MRQTSFASLLAVLCMTSTAWAQTATPALPGRLTVPLPLGKI